MTARYFSELPIAPDCVTVTLEGQEAHHLIHVMRLKAGAEVTIFDGSGLEFPARVEQVKRTTAELQILDRIAVDRELPMELTLGVALPKGDRQRWLVEKAVELGVTRLTPLSTKRGVAEAGGGALNRLRKSVIEAAKQCGRNRLMEIAEPVDVEGFFRSAPADALRLIAHPPEDDPPVGNALRGVPDSPVGSERHGERSLQNNLPIVLAVGSEGGFTDAEVATALDAGWRTVSLGSRILRIETAALALVAALTMDVQ